MIEISLTDLMYYLDEFILSMNTDGIVIIHNDKTGELPLISNFSKDSDSKRMIINWLVSHMKTLQYFVINIDFNYSQDKNGMFHTEFKYENNLLTEITKDRNFNFTNFIKSV